MSHFELDYCKLVSNVLEHGDVRPSRAGETISVFGAMLTIDCLRQGYFPILTQRKIFTQGVLGELDAFLQGAEDLQSFKAAGCNYWDANAAAWTPNKDVDPRMQRVGRIYGAQWRYWTGEDHTYDQLESLVRSLQQEPFSRRHLLTTYNPAELHDACLPPCHLLAQFNVRTDKHLDCIVTMRSVDLCLGLPSDIILYATLMLLLCNETGYTPGKLTFMMGDAHVYQNHAEVFQVHMQRPMHELPTFKLKASASINNFEADDLELNNYTHSGVLSYGFNV